MLVAGDDDADVQTLFGMFLIMTVVRVSSPRSTLPRSILLRSAEFALLAAPLAYSVGVKIDGVNGGVESIIAVRGVALEGVHVPVPGLE